MCECVSNELITDVRKKIRVFYGQRLLTEVAKLAMNIRTSNENNKTTARQRSFVLLGGLYRTLIFAVWSAVSEK